MPDILIRGLSANAIARVDAEAAATGLSRNEFLRRRFEDAIPPPAHDHVTQADLQRAADSTSDLLDPAIMADAWR